MNLRYLCIPAFLILAFSIPSPAQSLGDVARQLRAEEQKCGSPHPNVITNDDIASSEPAPAPTKKTENKGEETATANSAKGTKSSANAGKDATKERESQELATDQRSEEINKEYLDRIASIRTQINTAQQELAKLQLDQVESTNDFQRTLGTSPTPGEYAEQQHVFSGQIQSHRDLINNLNSQLEDAKEAARHAGVPHATD